MAGDKGDVLDMICRAVEIGMPDLRHYYRVTRKAKVVAVYPAEDGKYYADVQPLRNDETVDAKEPVVPKVAIPVIWGGADRGVVCPPCEGVLCDLSYYDGDPNYPHISNIRWSADMPAPAAELNEFVIQLEAGVEIRIDKEKQIIQLSSSNWKVEIDGNAEITAGGNVSLTAAENITLQAPQIVKIGNEIGSGTDDSTGTVTENVHRTTNGSLVVNGNVSINGSLVVSGGIDGRVNGCRGC